MINNILLIFATIICCFLFSKIDFKNQIQDLKESYLSTFNILKSKGNTDLIIAESIKQMKIILILLFKIILGVIPFLLFALYIFIFCKEGLRFFLSVTTNCIIIVTAILYYFIRRYVVK